MTFSSTCCMVFIGLSTTDTSGGFHSLQFHETTDKQASIQYMSHNNTFTPLTAEPVEWRPKADQDILPSIQFPCAFRLVYDRMSVSVEARCRKAS